MSDHLQVTSDEGALRFLADFCATTEPLCTHDELIVLHAPYGDFCDDHEIAPVSCYGCQGLFMATIYKTEQATELTPMSAAQIARYVPQPRTSSQAGSAWGNVA